MTEQRIAWYSLTRELRTEEHDPVDLAEALRIVDQYMARGDEKFNMGEDALAATIFGFSHSASEFIEICVNGPTQISYTFEMPAQRNSWMEKIFQRGVFRHEEELHSREEVIAKVREFFTTPVAEIQRRLKSRSS